jgi:hypothetical protein
MDARMGYRRRTSEQEQSSHGIRGSSFSLVGTLELISCRNLFHC